MTQMPPLDPSSNPSFNSSFNAPLPYATPPGDLADLQHLNLLSIFHFIVGPLVLLVGSIPIIHFVIGLMVFTGGMNMGGDPNFRWIGLIFMVVGGMFVLIGWSLGLLTIYSGLLLRRRRRRVFSVVIAGILCAFIPFGTVLGVFTLVVLLRPSVRSVYGER